MDIGVSGVTPPGFKLLSIAIATNKCSKSKNSVSIYGCALDPLDISPPSATTSKGKRPTSKGVMLRDFIVINF